MTGHYHDTFHRIEDTWWFDARTMFVDQIGDAEATTSSGDWSAHGLRCGAGDVDCPAEGGPRRPGPRCPFETPLAHLLDDYARADLNEVGVHILRSGIVHSLRMRLRAGQEWFRRRPGNRR